MSTQVCTNPGFWLLAVWTLPLTIDCSLSTIYTYYEVLHVHYERGPRFNAEGILVTSGYAFEMMSDLFAVFVEAAAPDEPQGERGVSAGRGGI